jgi:hypothetical protein
MLEKHLCHAGVGICLSGASASLDKLFRVNKMNYPRISADRSEKRLDVDSRRAAV